MANNKQLSESTQKCICIFCRDWAEGADGIRRITGKAIFLELAIFLGGGRAPGARTPPNDLQTLGKNLCKQIKIINEKFLNIPKVTNRNPA